MIRRLPPFILLLLIALDQLAATALFGATWAIGITKRRPNPDETISSRVGYYAKKGRRWARVCEWPINALFWCITGQWNHCRDHIEWDELA